MVILLPHVFFSGGLSLVFEQYGPIHILPKSYVAGAVCCDESSTKFALDHCYQEDVIPVCQAFIIASWYPEQVFKYVRISTLGPGVRRSLHAVST